MAIRPLRHRAAMAASSGADVVGERGNAGGHETRIAIGVSWGLIDVLVDERDGVIAAAVGGVEFGDRTHHPGRRVGPHAAGDDGSRVVDHRTGFVESPLAGERHPPRLCQAAFLDRNFEQVGELSDGVLRL